MKRYSPEHDRHWFLGISAYQWRCGVAPCVVLGALAGGWHAAGIVLVTCYLIAWLAWLFE